MLQEHKSTPSMDTVCAENPVHLPVKSEDNMKNILSKRLFVESRPCTIRLKNTFFLPNTKSLILACKPSSLKGCVPLCMRGWLTSSCIIFILLFLNGSWPRCCAKTFLSPSFLFPVTEAMSSAQHDGKRAD